MSNMLKFYLPLPTILLLGLFLSDILEWYYQSIERNQIIEHSSGTIFKYDTYTPKNEEYSIKNYDFVIVKNHNSKKFTETYYSNQGNISKFTYHDNKWFSSSFECITVSRANYFSLLGMFIFTIGILMRSIRTKQFFYIPSMNLKPFTKVELIPVVYGSTIFISAMFTPDISCYVAA